MIQVLNQSINETGTESINLQRKLPIFNQFNIFICVYIFFSKPQLFFRLIFLAKKLVKLFSQKITKFMLNFAKREGWSRELEVVACVKRGNRLQHYVSSSLTTISTKLSNLLTIHELTKYATISCFKF
jgi:hypothetical protein